MSNQPLYVSDPTVPLPTLWPAGVRAFQVQETRHDYSSRKQRAVIIVYELAPAIIRVNLTHDLYGEVSASGEVAMPWQYFVFTLRPSGWEGEGGWTHCYPYLNLFWSKSRLKSLDEKVIGALVPDIERNYTAQVCLGTLSKPVNLTEGFEWLTEIIKVFYEYSKGSQRHSGRWNIPSAYKDVKEWEEASEADPYCYLGWKEFETEKKYKLSQLIASQKKEEAVKPAIVAAAKAPVVPKPRKPRAPVKIKAEVEFAKPLNFDAFYADLGKIPKFVKGVAVIKEKPVEGKDYVKVAPKLQAGIDYQIIPKPVAGIDFQYVKD